MIIKTSLPFISQFLINLDRILYIVNICFSDETDTHFIL